MTDPQQVANRVREGLDQHELVRRLGIEVLRASGSFDELTIRAFHDGTVLTAVRRGSWWQQPVERLAEDLGRELVADVLAPPPPRWSATTRRSGSLASRRSVGPAA